MKDCLEKIAENKYRCKKHGFIVTSSSDNIVCPKCEFNTKGEFPPLKEQAKTFIKAAVDHAKSGFTNVTNEIYEARIAVCNKCEFYQGGRCLRCGCFIGIKAHWSTQECPENKWHE